MSFLDADKEAHEKAFRSIFEERIVSEQAFLKESKRLFYAFEVLADQYVKNLSDNSDKISERYILPQAWLLLGMSFECAIKSRVISNHSKKDSIPKGFYTHILGSHLELAGLMSFYLENKDFFDGLSECILWFGRYPVPKKGKDFFYIIENEQFYRQRGNPFPMNSTFSDQGKINEARRIYMEFYNQCDS